jgi:hypothetical protein
MRLSRRVSLPRFQHECLFAIPRENPLQGKIRMKILLFLTSASAALLALTQAHANLVIDVLDNGVSVGTAESTTGSVVLDVTTDPAFDTIGVDATGAPILPEASLSSATMAVSSASFSGTHTLTVDVLQSGFEVHNTESTFNVDNFVGEPGPTTESTFGGPTTNFPERLLLDTATFPAGTMASTVGPLSNGISEITADGSQYVISFTQRDQSVSDTIELATSSPELSTWAMMLLGFAGLGFVGYRRALRTA